MLLTPLVTKIYNIQCNNYVIRTHDGHGCISLVMLLHAGGCFTTEYIIYDIIIRTSDGHGYILLVMIFMTGAAADPIFTP